MKLTLSVLLNFSYHFQVHHMKLFNTFGVDKPQTESEVLLRAVQKWGYVC